jgi:tetratricopeptide (TPR) repeat protein
VADPQSKSFPGESVSGHRPRRLADDPHLTRRQREDPLVIGWYRLQDWMVENVRAVAIVAAIVVGGVIAGVLWSRARADKEARGNARLAEASVTYWRNDYPRVGQLSAQIQREFSGTSAAVEVLRIEGDALFWQGEFQKAADSYNAYLQKNRTPSLVRNGVRANLAQAYESAGKPAEAAKLYDELSRDDAPRTVLSERALAAAQAYHAAGDTARSLALFRRVTAEFAETPSAREAEIALGEIELR